MKYFNKSSLDLITSNIDLIKYFINNGIPIKDDKEGRKYIIPNPLIFSVKQNSYSFTKILLEHNASINEIDSDHKNALIYAIDNNNRSIIDLLLKYNFDINKAFDERDISPIIYTVEKNDTSLFNYLLQTVSSELDKNQIISSIITYSLNHIKFEMIDFIKDNFKYDINYISNIIYELLKQNKINMKDKNNNGYTLLHHVCFRGNLYILNELLNIHQDFNIYDNENKTPLMIAIINKKYDCVKYLLRKDPLLDVNYCDKFGETAFSYLLKNFDYDEEMIELFYDKGFYFKKKDFREKALLKYIIKCTDLLKIFIEKGIRFKTDKNEIKIIKTPIIFAVKYNIKILLISLLNLKANVNETDEDNKSPLYYAINNNNNDFINILLNFNGDINQDIMSGKTPLIYIIENDKKNVFSNLIQNRNIQDNLNYTLKTLYNYVLQLKNYSIIGFLDSQLKDKNYDIYAPFENLLNSSEYDINETDHENEWTLLHYACIIGNVNIVNILLKKRPEKKFLIDVNKKCIDGSTPLMLSIKNGKFECASKLIDNHSNVNIVDNNLDTPLTYMLKHNNSFNEYVFNKLLENEAYLPIKYIKEGDDLKYIINNKLIMKRITYQGIRIQDEESNIILIHHPLIYAVKDNNITLTTELIKNGVKINDIDENNNNALYYSIINKNIELVKLLLSHNIEFIYSKIDEKSPLLISIKQNDSNLFKLIINNINGSKKDKKIDEIVESLIQYAKSTNNYNIVKFIHKHLNRNNYSNYEKLNNIMIENDKNYNIKEYKEIQPLHYACMEGNIDNIKYLIKSKNIEINERNNDGSTPLMVTIKNNKYDAFKLLLELCNNIDVNIADYNNITPIKYLINNRIDNIEIYKFLFIQGAYLDLDFIQYNPNIDILLKSDPLNHFIIENGIKINNNNVITKVKNLVRYAIDNNHNKLLSILVENSLIDIKKENFEGKNIIEYVVEKNNKNAFDILINLISPEEMDSVLRPIVNYIFSTKLFSNLYILKNCSNNSSINNVIDDAINNRELYKKKGYEPLYESVLKENIKLINDLIQLGYNVNNISNNNKETALIVAIKNKKYEIVKILLNTSNIDVNVSDNSQQTPLIYMINDVQSLN
eukprot:jgi/Orpsp1_1/1176550/evm.model.c7180000058050.1